MRTAAEPLIIMCFVHLNTYLLSRKIADCISNTCLFAVLDEQGWQPLISLAWSSNEEDRKIAVLALANAR
jgi:hypothetical protein